MIDRYLGLDVAIKEVLESNEYDVDKYFRRECTLMKECRHPNIVQFIGLCLAPESPPEYLPSLQLWDSNKTAGDNSNSAPPKPSRRRVLIISEYLPNGNLRSHIANTKLDFGWRLRMSFSVDVARALAYLHARNCLHRDLKGENLLITDNDRIKVCDFGFARIAARNEEEMRRMSYCGTDGYMSPQILMGDEFGLETDIFSLGVIFCEIISRQLVDDEVFKREMPTFGLDSDEIRQRASPGCPPAFIELAIACVQVEPSDRPTIRTVLNTLMSIEREVIEAQAATEKAYNVGSLTFSSRNTGRNYMGSKVKRPAGPGRIPSFQGQIEGPKYSDSDKDDTAETSDEDVDDTLAKLSKLQIGNGRTGSGFYLNAKHAEAHSCLNSDKNTTEGSARPDTYSVIKGPKTGTRSSIIFHSPEYSDARTTTSSAITVKPDHASMESFGTPGSLPSLPSSWLRMGKEEDSDASTESALIQQQPVLSDDTFGDGSAQDIGPQSDEGIESTTVSAIRISLPAASTQQTAEGATPPAVVEKTEAAVEMPIDKFATIKSLSMPIHVPVEARSPPLSGPDSRLFSPHRFTLIKPGWRALWDSNPAEKPLKRNSMANPKADGELLKSRVRKTSEAGAGLMGVVPMQLFGAGLLTRCHVCEKRLGLLKPYLSCDDCQHVYHVRCGDLTSPDCGLPDELDGDTTAGKPAGAGDMIKQSRLNDKLKRGKRDSKKLSKSPRTSLISVS